MMPIVWVESVLSAVLLVNFMCAVVHAQNQEGNLPPLSLDYGGTSYDAPSEHVQSIADVRRPDVAIPHAEPTAEPHPEPSDIDLQQLDLTTRKLPSVTGVSSIVEYRLGSSGRDPAAIDSASLSSISTLVALVVPAFIFVHNQF